MKKILIAIPTARYIEADTFKSIYDLDIPEGYEAEFQYFYGYRVDQVRNLIADWVVRGYDYLFAVDHDVTFPRDTLRKMLEHDRDLISGVYRQRLEPQQIEIFGLDGRRLDYNSIHGKDLVQIGACGFGCTLVKKHVLAAVGYPQFEYFHALDHNNTISEDTDFCKKALMRGFTLWCDPSILCGHIGMTIMNVEVPKDEVKDLWSMRNEKINSSVVYDNESDIQLTSQPDDPIKRLRKLHDLALLPQDHSDYLQKMKNDGIEPKVIYDIGACVLHWTNAAKKVWPDAKIIPFEAMEEVAELYREQGLDTWVTAVLSDKEEIVDFYQNLEHPGGNSMFKENVEYSTLANDLFPEDKKIQRKTERLDDIVWQMNLPKPDMIKMDIQGAELNALKGATETLKTVNHLILELQHVEYNTGAPRAQDVIDYLATQGFGLVGRGLFCSALDAVDGDYHFMRLSEASS